MQIIDDKVLLVPTTDPAPITSLITKAKLLSTTNGVAEVAVYWDMEGARKLASLRTYEVPSPILRDYTWTGRLTPFEHQKTTSSFLTLHDRAFCFNEQGTGKTASVIWAADYLMQRGEVSRVLVLCPLSIMDSAWRQDLFKFAMHRSCSVAHGSAKQRAKILDAGSEFVILNFDGLAVVEDEITNGGFDLIVVDECFVEGTQVHTPEGPKAIETLNAGDVVFTSNGVAPIKTVKRRESADIVEVRLYGGERITCTGEHPFFTDVGWVVARNLAGRRLISNGTLPRMRERVHYAHQGMGVAPESGDQQVSNLLEVLRTEEVAQGQSGEILFQGHAAGETRESRRLQTVPGDAAAYIGEAESHRAQTHDTRGEWLWSDPYGSTGPRGLGRRMDMELPSSVGAEAARLSYELQARLCRPGKEAGAGGGWWKPYICVTEGAGQEEGSQASGAWVESVSSIECGGKTPVFNLEVEGTPNYFVGGGWLVHNCNAYKNPMTNRWKVLNRLMNNIKPRLWMLTGTPAAQSPVDAFGLAKLVNPDNTPKYYGQFRDSVMYKVTQFQWNARPNAEQTVHKVLQPAIRFEKKDCLDLPEVTHIEREAPLTKMQLAWYKLLKSEMKFEAAGEGVSAVNAATKLNKLLQISGGAVYTDDGQVLEFDVSNRLNVVMEVIEEAANKVLVFVPFTHTIELLKARLIKEGVSCEVINGKVPVTRRGEIVTEFQTRKDPHVLIIQPQAASHGLTLTAADTVIWYAPVTSVETYLQANARINRPGQKNAMTVVHIRGSDVEAKLYHMLQNNITNHEKIIDLYKRVLNDEQITDSPDP